MLSMVVTWEGIGPEDFGHAVVVPGTLDALSSDVFHTTSPWRATVEARFHEPLRDV